MKKLEHWILDAIEAIKEAEITIDTNHNTVPKEYNGYISSFATSIKEGGLIPTIAFYTDENKSRGDRTKLPTAIYLLLVKKGIINQEQNNNLFNWINMYRNDKYAYNKEQVLFASTALKLALRTFIHKKNEKNDD